MDYQQIEIEYDQSTYQNTGVTESTMSETECTAYMHNILYVNMDNQPPNGLHGDYENAVNEFANNERR